MFGIGAAALVVGHAGKLPPGAQAADQLARHGVGRLERRLEGLSPTRWRHSGLASRVLLERDSRVDIPTG